MSYYARKTTKDERGWDTRQLELLAVISTLENFHVLIDGHAFTLKTDHKNLKWLMRHRRDSRNADCKRDVVRVHGILGVGVAVHDVPDLPHRASTRAWGAVPHERAGKLRVEGIAAEVEVDGRGVRARPTYLDAARHGRKTRGRCSSGAARSSSRQSAQAGWCAGRGPLATLPW